MKNQLAGTIKFDATVSVTTLETICKDLKSKDPENWINLHIRGAGDDGTHYIALHYILADDEEKTHKKAFHNFMQLIKNRLGTRPMKSTPKGVKGWSISNVLVTF